MSSHTHMDQPQPTPADRSGSGGLVESRGVEPLTDQAGSAGAIDPSKTAEASGQSPRQDVSLPEAFGDLAAAMHACTQHAKRTNGPASVWFIKGESAHGVTVPTRWVVRSGVGPDASPSPAAREVHRATSGLPAKS